MRYGHFDNEKKEYVIDNVALPASWTNYLGVKEYMCRYKSYGGRIYVLQIAGISQGYKI